MAAAAMCRRLVPRRLASAAWKNPTAIGRLRPGASPAGGVRWLTETSIFSKPDLGKHKEPEEARFSWKLEDLLNPDFFKNKVKKIPTIFTSQWNYTGSFKVPLMEETRADLCSALEDISQAPVAQVEVVQIKEGRVRFKAATSSDRCYSPKDEDILVFTRRKPTHSSDLNPYVIGIVRGGTESKDGKGITMVELLSGTLPVERSPLFAVFLINEKTSNRILDALGTLAIGDTRLIRKTAEYAPAVSQECNSLLPELPNSQLPDEALDGLEKFDLNTSQKNGVLDCVSAMEQDTSYWVRLICGPPGTGKTKTIVSLLWSMMIKNHRTLACAPTNTAVAEVAFRLLSLLEDDSYGGGGKHFSLSDVVLLGTKDRFNVDEKLANMFLEQRLSRLKGADWQHYASCLVGLLEKPLTEHSSYLRSVRTGIMDLDWKMEGRGELERESLRQEQQNVKLKDFFLDNYEYNEECLRGCVEVLRNDLPRCATSGESFRFMDELLHMLGALGKLMQSDPKRLTRKLFFKNSLEWPEFQEAKALCIDKLKHLPDHFDLPSSYARCEEYILNNAKIMLCTACSSSQLSQRRNLTRLRPLDLLVVDEAAQLRECELLIPLRSGIRRAVLIGDDCQLPALVKSKLSAEADYGRSLFERLRPSSFEPPRGELSR